MLAWLAANNGDSSSLGRRRVIRLSFCPIESSDEEMAAGMGLPPPPPPESAPAVSFFGNLYGTKLMTAGSLKSISRTTHSPPSRSLDFKSFRLSRALMNFFAFFQLVFLICKEAAWLVVWIGRYGKTIFEITSD